MLTMPPPRKKKPDPKPARPGVFLRPGEERAAALAAFIASQTVPPKVATVILQAVDEFLARNGFPVKPKGKG